MSAAPLRSAINVNRVVDAARRRLPVVHFGVDSVLWLISIPLAGRLRYDYRSSQLDGDVFPPVVFAVVLQGCFGLATGLYRRRWRYGSFDEVRTVALTAASVGAALMFGLWQWNAIPRSVPMLATGLALLGQITARSMWRLHNESRNRPNGEHLQRLVVVGAGEGGDQVLRTGLRPSEKLHEDLISPDEAGERRVHKLFTHVAAPGLAPTEEMTGGPVPEPDRMRAIGLSGLPASVDV